MNIKGLEIKNNISAGELIQIEDWLKLEATEFSGFYYQLTYIKQVINTEKLFIIKENSIVIGFLVWRDNEIIVEIDIFEIKREYRRKGIGKYFINELRKYWKDKNFKIMNLYCSPIKSELFWKSIGFIKYPKIKQFDIKIYYYKPLITVNEPVIELNCCSKLELWNIYDKKDSLITWKIEKNNFLPIIYPCHKSWMMRIIKDNEILYEDEVEYFFMKKIL